jgi:hypothetical protein
MIKYSRNPLFGGQIAIIRNYAFHCMVQTGKEGLFLSHSTVIHEIVGSDELSDSKLIARLVYFSASTKKQCLEVHQKIVERLNTLSQDQWNMTLEVAVEMVTFQFSDCGHWEWLAAHTEEPALQRVFARADSLK